MRVGQVVVDLERPDRGRFGAGMDIMGRAEVVDAEDEIGLGEAGEGGGVFRVFLD
jgi:hypothetical protein